MKKKLFFLLACLSFMQDSKTIVSIEKIVNLSRFVFDIVEHSSDSPCALFKEDIQLYRIHPQDTFEPSVIMQKGDRLVLRPVAYFDYRQQEFIHMYDRNGILTQEGVAAAYEAWKYHKPSRRKWTQADWMKKWVGGDIVVSMKEEICGYMLHVIHAATANYQHIDHAWPVYSQGAYSSLGVVLSINEDDKKGVRPRLNSTGSRGVMCQNGTLVHSDT